MNSSLPVILAADDSAEDRELLEHLLRKAGVANPIVFADSGESAIAALQHSCPEAGNGQGCKPAVVFLDVNMPRGDGFRVLEWIRKEDTLRKTPVFMMTDSTRPADIQRAEQLKADGYLLKHPDADTIASVVGEASRKASSAANANRANSNASDKFSSFQAGHEPVKSESEDHLLAAMCG